MTLAVFLLQDTFTRQVEQWANNHPVLYPVLSISFIIIFLVAGFRYVNWKSDRDRKRAIEQRKNLERRRGRSRL